MTDKEVGELWRNIHDMKHWSFDTTKQLIRKLVEERAHHIYDRAGESYTMSQGPQYEYCLMAALRDFGIDPKDYPNDT
jgi:hypothetical protein